MPEIIPTIGATEEDAADTGASPADIRLAAMNLLARREHSLRELRTKLKRRFPDVTLLDEQLSRLTDENLQCDLRFAESYARQRISRGYGPLRVPEELRERGVSEDDVALAMEQLDVDWRALATEVMQKKFGDLPPGNFKEKARRARFMQYRGFSAEHYRPMMCDQAP
jgi:regulatory protein